MNKRQLRFDRGTLLFLLTNLNIASRLTSFISPANSPGRSSFCASGRRIEIESPSVLCFLSFFFLHDGNSILPDCVSRSVFEFFLSLLLFFVFIVSHRRNLLSFVRIRSEQSDDRFVEWIIIGWLKNFHSNQRNRRGVVRPKISCALERCSYRSAGQPVKIDTQFELLIQQDARIPTTR